MFTNTKPSIPYQTSEATRYGVENCECNDVERYSVLQIGHAAWRILDVLPLRYADSDTILRRSYHLWEIDRFRFSSSLEEKAKLTVVYVFKWQPKHCVVISDP